MNAYNLAVLTTGSRNATCGYRGALRGARSLCAHREGATELQDTSTGLAFWRKATNTTTFTNGSRHWASTADGVVSWSGAGLDPPGITAALSPPTRVASDAIPPLPAPEIALQSPNWAGYVAVRRSFAGVGASWNIPPLVGGAGQAGVWVGIDGATADNDRYLNRTILQAGTDFDAQGVLYAWLEVLPAASIRVPLQIQTCDRISVSIVLQPQGTWLVSLDNLTSGQRYQRSMDYQALNESAECIVEAPDGPDGQQPLGNFGTITFQECWVRDRSSASSRQPVGRGPRLAVSMIDADHSPLAKLTALTDAGGFDVVRH